MSEKIQMTRIAFAGAAAVLTLLQPYAALGGVFDYRDALDLAVATPDEQQAQQRTDRLNLYVGNDFSYDDNLYRLPSSVTDLAVLPGIGSNPTRSDYIDSVTAGLNSEWLIGNRQSVDLDLRADDNRYFRNTNLDNISSNDHAAWNWGLGSALSGAVGADYSQVLGGFVNTGAYARDIVVKSDYFASLRYQIGPRWGLFGGIMDENYKLTDANETFNDSKSKAVDIGADYTTNAANRIGFDYRYTDDRSPNAALLNGVTFDPDYREDRARFLLHYAPSEKTAIDASGGYLRREYPSAAIGSFSGEIWRVSFQWQPTAKIQLVAGTWRQLTADLTAQTDYYVSRGETLAPVWTVSEKVAFTLSVTQENQDYVGSNPVGVNPVEVQSIARHDVVTTESANMVYTFSRALSLSVTAGHEKRDSNDAGFEYNDFRADANITYKFFRYGEPQ
jgi:exopolysaccharide biosynthesis operon protein EpsL